MSLFKRSGNPFPVPPVSPFPGVSLMNSGAPNTNDQAMRIGAVWACVRLLAESVSMMPLQGFNEDDRGNRIPLKKVPSLLVQPDPTPGMTVAGWVYQIMVSLLLSGNCYGLIQAIDGYGYPTAIAILNPETVQMRQDKDTHRWGYFIRGAKAPDSGVGSIWHIPAFLMPGSPVGLSPIKYAAVTTGTLSAVENFARGFFEDGAHPTAVLLSDQSINQDQARTIKDRVMAAVSGREPAVLGQGVRWETIQISPEESQFLETQKFNIAQIARVYGVPPEMVGGHAENGMTYANVTQRGLDFLTYSCQGWITRIEAALFPLLAGVKHIRFDTSALIRLDPVAKWESNRLRLDSGSSNINEIRSEDGLGPVPWGSQPWLPGIKTTAAGQAIQWGSEPGSRAKAMEKDPALAEGTGE